MIKSIMIRIAIVLVGIIVVVLGRGLFYYSGSYSPPPTEIPSYEQVVVPMPPSTGFSDVYEEGEGTILIDLAHYNAFDIEELNVLTLRLISRGLTTEFFKTEDNLETELLGEEVIEEEEEEKEAEEEEAAEEEEVVGEEGATQEEEVVEEEKEELEEELPDAFIVVCPQKEFSKKEKETINEFVTNGGKLLLIADPTRRDKMNTLSLDYGLIFEPDCLYNMKEYETNFQNIFVTDFKESEITKELNKVVFYRAGSISSAEGGIAFVDENTVSSLVETKEKLSPIALANDSKVLGIHDLTFMTEPHNGILDNNQLIANIADWLASPAEEEEEQAE